MLTSTFSTMLAMVCLAGGAPGYPYKFRTHVRARVESRMRIVPCALRNVNRDLISFWKLTRTMSTKFFLEHDSLILYSHAQNALWRNLKS